MSICPLSLSWEIRRPPICQPNDPEWLTELAEMRGRVLYAGGRRALFRQREGTHFDDDPLDRAAYHVLLRNPDRLIGCIRIVPLEKVQRCRTESLLGSQRFARLLIELGTTRDRVGEVGRWVVMPEYAAFRMGWRLIAGVGGLATCLGLEAVVAVVGTRDGQAKTLKRAGGRPVPGLSAIKSEEYDDDLVVLTFDVTHPPNSIRLLAADMAIRLLLDRVEHVEALSDEVLCVT